MAFVGMASRVGLGYIQVSKRPLLMIGESTRARRWAASAENKVEAPRAAVWGSDYD